MAIQGKKINELTEITTLTDESVLPAVKVESGVAANQAGKVTIDTLKDFVNQGMQTELTAGEGIDITNNIISATGTIPDNVYTEDNLLAGNNLEIVNYPNYIDSNTLIVCHFDNNLNNVVPNSSITLVGSPTYYSTNTVNNHLGTYARLLSFGVNNLQIDQLDYFTFEAWVKFDLSYSGYIGVGLNTISYNAATQKIQIEQNSTILQQLDYTKSKWIHIAIESSILDEWANFYVDGDYVCNSTMGSGITIGGINNFSSNFVYVDEFRFSDICRYETNSYNPPLVPYLVPEVGVMKKLINCTTEVVSEINNQSTDSQIPTAKCVYEALSGIGGGVPTLTWYTGNTGTTVTIDDTTSASLVKIYKNGILLQEGNDNDYTINGTTLTLATSLIATDKITTEIF